MRFELLGALRVIDADGPVLISAPKMECLLATLLIRANQVVTCDEISTALWGDHPPRRAGASMHAYVSQLRKVVRDTPESESPIVTRSSGYLIEIEPGELDLDVMRRLMRDGRTALRENRHAQAAMYLQQAIDLWRGPTALPGLADGPVLGGFATWAAALRLECYEMLIEAKAAMGHHGELVGVLRGLLAEHPLHEMFCRQYMTALSAAERRAEALEFYRDTRGRMSAELGIEPGRALRDVHQAILLDAEPESFVAESLVA